MYHAALRRRGRRGPGGRRLSGLPNPKPKPKPKSKPKPSHDPNPNPNPNQVGVDLAAALKNCVAIAYATQGSNPGLADRVPARPATHACGVASAAMLWATRAPRSSAEVRGHAATLASKSAR
eukprot:scaffold120087_cov60-Phaeocystis_antarctica.AAC.2